MNNKYFNISEADLQKTKQKIWHSLRNKLPERGLKLYQKELHSLRLANNFAPKPNTAKFIESLPDRKPFISIFSFSYKKISAFASLAFLALFIFAPVFGAPKTMASSVNTLEITNGTAWVNGDLAKNNQIIKAGDIVKTDADSEASIYFADDSRMALDAQTQIALSQINIDPFDKTKSSIIVNQATGRSWVQVINLVSEESNFVVNLPSGNIEIKNQASVDIKASNNYAQLQVARSMVQVNESADQQQSKSFDEKNDKPLILETGEAIGLYGSQSIIKLTPKQDDWFSDNFALDSEHVKKIDSFYKQQAHEQTDLVPGDLFYPVKTFRESVQENFAFSESAKIDLVKKHAENRLNEAQVLLDSGDTENAKLALLNYEEKVKKVSKNNIEIEAEMLAMANKQLLVVNEVRQDLNLSVNIDSTDAEVIAESNGAQDDAQDEAQDGASEQNTEGAVDPALSDAPEFTSGTAYNAGNLNLSTANESNSANGSGSASGGYSVTTSQSGANANSANSEVEYVDERFIDFHAE